MSQKSDLPFGSEFSPSQIDLKDLLEIVGANNGDAKKLQDAIRNKYFSKIRLARLTKRNLQ